MRPLHSCHVHPSRSANRPSASDAIPLVGRAGRAWRSVRATVAADSDKEGGGQVSTTCFRLGSRPCAGLLTPAPTPRRPDAEGRVRSLLLLRRPDQQLSGAVTLQEGRRGTARGEELCQACLLYTSDAADEEDSVDLG